MEICKIGLRNYFAGALVLPYQTFLAAAKELRHDLELLASRFGASLEQVAHRLSTLQRSGQRGVPVFFARVDRAGNITKRHSAAKLQFARYGAACPLWNVHQAFETPGRIIRQLAETPDGARYLCIATELTKARAALRRRSAVTPSRSVVKSPMRRISFMPMGWISPCGRLSIRLAFRAVSANVPNVCSVPFRRLTAGWRSTMTAGAFCLIDCCKIRNRHGP